jgi:hypothetical protein
LIRLFRNPRSRLRRTWLLTACAAIALQVAVPAGLMLDPNEATGELIYVLCPSQGATPDAPARTGNDGYDEHADHSPTGEPHTTYDMPGEVCDFAVASSTTPIIAAPAVVAMAQAAAIEPVIESRLVAPSSVARTAVSSRGPPQYS